MADPQTLTSRAELIEYLAAGCKPKDAWRIGTEHEKFGFDRASLQPLPYEGERGIQAILEGLAGSGWDRIEEHGLLVGLRRDGASITLEPGGQLELSGAPLETIHQTCREVNAHLRDVKEVADPLGVGFLGMGFHPLGAREDFHWMPKGRYKIMREYMPRVGDMGIDMMLRTCTVQVNLDFSSEADMVRKFRVGLALQPIATALFANSPFTEGQPNGYLSLRSHAWTRTDADRVGMLPFVFEDGMGFERWVDYVLDVPMYFVYRDGEYIDASGLSFRDFLAGQLSVLPGEQPSVRDWEDHLTTIFTEVRLKRFLEMRGADGGPWRRLCALPALWVGLLYDDESLDAAWELSRHWTIEQRQQLRDEVPKLGFAAKIGNVTVGELSRQVLSIARDGLARRARLSASGRDETAFLNSLDEICTLQRTPAERKLALYRTEWGRSVRPLFEECAY